MLVLQAYVCGQQSAPREPSMRDLRNTICVGHAPLLQYFYIHGFLIIFMVNFTHPCMGARPLTNVLTHIIASLFLQRVHGFCRCLYRHEMMRVVKQNVSTHQGCIKTVLGAEAHQSKSGTVFCCLHAQACLVSFTSRHCIIMLRKHGYNTTCSCFPGICVHKKSLLQDTYYW